MDENDAKMKYVKLVKEVDPTWDEELNPSLVSLSKIPLLL